jgi:O-antigen/teichoic acid export membrane protein
MRRFLPDTAVIALLLLLPLILFHQQTIGGQTLLPVENLFQYEPFASYRAEAGAPSLPHNALVSDLILQNYQWKSFILESLALGEVPLWNPHQFSGIPFMAAGQQSTLYPFSLLYYVLPLWLAYGWFTVVQLWLAGVFMFAFARGLGIGRGGAALAGVVYQLSGFFVISAVFPMIIASAVWLPLILLMIEYVIRQQPALKQRPASLPWVAVGALALGCNILAGHVEITYYTLLIAAYYAAVRLLWEFWRGGRGAGAQTAQARTRQASSLRFVVMRGAWLLVMVALGVGLGAVQFIPLFEVASTNFRVGSADFAEVLGWAHPARDVLMFIMPNFYGNPTHHAYLDVFSGTMIPATVNASGQPITVIDWGIKNYVEGALYLGILPLVLSVFALFYRTHDGTTRPPYRALFALLGLLALTFMFGLPTYALLYYTLPGIDQLHSPFRWIFAVTLSVAVLAGFGWDALLRVSRRPVRLVAWGLIGAGAAICLVLLVTRLAFPQVEPLIDRFFRAMAKAPDAFADARMFYSYQFTNVLLLGVMLLLSGGVFWAAFVATRTRTRYSVSLHGFAVILVAVDLMIASWNFNPASDPALLDYTPPAVEWLRQQEGEWRYTTLDDPTQPPLMNANLGLRYGLDDIRGYESIIPMQYVVYMQTLAPQVQLEYNRVAPLYTTYGDGFDYREALVDSPILDALNVRFLLTHSTTDIDVPGYELVYEDAGVRIWENSDALPRAALMHAGGQFSEADITRDTGREKWVDVSVPDDGAAWSLIISESYDPGWRAFIRPQASGEDAETPLDVHLHDGNLQRVELNEPGDYTLRLVYSPQSFQVGLFGSFISAVILVFLLGVWLWRLYVSIGDDASAASRVAKNSIAPIALNLFNRGIDFGFAIVMLRLLGAEGAGVYYYAAIIFGWFEIFTNFGLNLYLTREVARDRGRARAVLLVTSGLRLALVVVGVPLLALFLGIRQSFVAPPLTTEALLVIALLYIGLIPNSFSTGLSALFYAFERAEVPAAIATISTISKVILGLVALLLGFGAVGLAGVSIITNVLTLGIMLMVGRALFAGSRAAADSAPAVNLPALRSTVGESFPLMLNHFLASIFFQIDVVLIEALHGARMVGQYSVAYKWVLALNIIPAFFTQALLPVMSRLSSENRAAFRQNYGLAITLLFSLALPVAIVFTFLAYALTGLLGGAEFLPDGAIALQLMIWSIPIGWMNSLTQYVLIALDLQRRITRAFALGVSFNIVTNLIFIPTYGYQAAALTTIASELILFVAFAWLLHSELGRIAWWGLLWRPLAAGVVMLTMLLIGWAVLPLVALPLALLAYVGLMAVFYPEWTNRGVQLIQRRLSPGIKKPL